MKNDTEAVALYTDGACLSNPGGPGGWAWVAVVDDVEVARDSGHEPRTTNQRMEILAAIKAVSSLGENESAVVVSDSLYVVNCFRGRWYVKWESNGFRTSHRKPVKNADLWRLLIRLVRERNVTFAHVRGHNGHCWNELADYLAARQVVA